MAKVKLTKNELRAQQHRLGQLNKYLPTLQLKKAMLQIEVNDARQQVQELEGRLEKLRGIVEASCSLLVEKVAIDPTEAAKVKKVKKHYENIAGVEVPYYEGIEFVDFTYSLMETPPWIDGVIASLRKIAETQAEVQIAHEKYLAIEKEWREVSIRVNLFEKRLIPEAKENIKQIKVFLGDLQLAAVSQAKVAKKKIEERSLYAI